MSVMLQVVLVIMSVLAVVYVLKKIRKATVQIEDIIYWIFFSFALLILSAFPKIAEYGAVLLGIKDSANFVFLFIIFLLLMKLFKLTIEVSEIKAKLKCVVQELAISDYEDRLRK